MQKKLLAFAGIALAAFAIFEYVHLHQPSVDASVIAAQNCVPGPGEKCPTAEWLDHYNEYFAQAKTIVQMEHDPEVKKLTDAQFQLNGLADWLNDPKNTPPGYTFNRQTGKLVFVPPPAAPAPPPAPETPAKK